MLKLWKRHDVLPSRATAIVAISYGATEARLTNASLRVARKANLLSRKYQGAKVFWGDFSKNPLPDVEIIEKQKVLPALGCHYVGKVSSSTDECEAVLKRMTETKTRFDSIIVVPDESHSRRDMLAWEYYFPHSELFCDPISAEEAEDLENPMWFQRRWKVWLCVNILGWVVYKIFGVRIMGRLNFSQPTRHRRRVR